MSYTRPPRRQLRKQFPRKASEALRMAAERLKGRWVQGTFERRVALNQGDAPLLGPDDSFVCMMGAINWAITGHAQVAPVQKRNSVRREVFEQAHQCATAALPKSLGRRDIPFYNDMEGRTERQARNALLKAAKLCEKEGH